MKPKRRKTRNNEDWNKPHDIIFNGVPVARVWYDSPKAMFFYRFLDSREQHTCGDREDAVERVRATYPKSYRSMVHLRRLKSA